MTQDKIMRSPFCCCYLGFPFSLLPPPQSYPLPQCASPMWQPFPSCVAGTGQFGAKSTGQRASLVVQWLRIRLPMQGTRVRALVREDPTCRRATKPAHHNYWACALGPVCHNYWAHMLQLLKSVCLEPVLHNKRSHRSEKPGHRNKD